MARLDGKVAIVTGGGGSGIGHGISLELARAGACTAIFEIDLAAGEEVRDQIRSSGGEAVVIRADISSAAEVRSAVEEVIRRLRRIDALINNAGIGLIGPVAEVSEEEFDRLAAVDLRGAWLCSKYVIPHMQRQRDGAIVNVACRHPVSNESAADIISFTCTLCRAARPRVSEAKLLMHSSPVCRRLLQIGGRTYSGILVRLWVDNYAERGQPVPNPTLTNTPGCKF